MSAKRTDKEGQEGADGEAQVTSPPPASAHAEAVGACFYVDAEGQNRCLVTTESMCKKMPNSEFHPGRNCPDF